MSEIKSEALNFEIIDLRTEYEVDLKIRELIIENELVDKGEALVFLLSNDTNYPLVKRLEENYRALVPIGIVHNKMKNVYMKVEVAEKVNSCLEFLNSVTEGMNEDIGEGYTVFDNQIFINIFAKGAIHQNKLIFDVNNQTVKIGELLVPIGNAKIAFEKWLIDESSGKELINLISPDLTVFERRLRKLFVHHYFEMKNFLLLQDVLRNKLDYQKWSSGMKDLPIECLVTQTFYWVNFDGDLYIRFGMQSILEVISKDEYEAQKNKAE